MSSQNVYLELVSQQLYGRLCALCKRFDEKQSGKLHSTSNVRCGELLNKNYYTGIFMYLAFASHRYNVV